MTTTNELCIDWSELTEVDYVYYFFYNVHNKMRKGDYEDIQGNKFRNTSFEVYDEFNPLSVEKFLSDELGSQLVRIFITNYSAGYLDIVRGSYKEEVSKIIQELKQKLEA